ncbi:hypothetical protein V1504DRAFT_453418 [Lipomyces starkeyi]
MRLTAKRRAKDNEPAIPVVSEISTGAAALPSATRPLSTANALDSSSESAGSTTDKSSAMSATVSKDMPPVKDDTIFSEYEDVFRLLTENPPEQILDVHLPFSKYTQMGCAFSRIKADKNISEDQRYPCLEYNNLTETVTVVTVPNSIHEVAVYELNSDIIAGANDYLSEHAPELLDHILPLGSTTKKDFEGDFSNSSKQADGGIEYRAIDGACVTIAIEVGISQSYKSLCDAKDMWINGHHVKVCILVCFNELPLFKSPTSAYDDIEDVQTEIVTMGQSAAEPMGWYTSHGYYGPIFYRGHRWTGELTGSFIEVWRAGCSSPDRYVSECSRMDCLLINHLKCMLCLGTDSGRGLQSPTLGLKMSDLCPAGCQHPGSRDSF